LRIGTRRPSTTTARSRPRCRAYDPLNWGADAIYDIVDGQLEFRGYFKMPAPQVDEENCVAHNGSIIPIPGRDIFVQAWYQGGISVIDFTDSANSFEIAFFDRGPIDAEDMVVGGFWSTYWYRGRIYGTEIVRGLDVLKLVPSEHITANEIAAAAIADQGDVFNPQQQFPVTWPAEPVVARAYIDQLARDEALDAVTVGDLSRTLDSVEQRIGAGERDRVLAKSLERFAGGLGGDAASVTIAKRRAGLAEMLQRIAARLR
jgi:hypothetical protein